ncbi:calcium-binding protein [Jannaschia sp. 2305UL9-9]|uniref:calcium-binding protein n=1 Tax=Jannaschia sp. 2305UL9-9 TaxID=3121638 RepID=UPI00352756A2
MTTYTFDALAMLYDADDNFGGAITSPVSFSLAQGAPGLIYETTQVYGFAFDDIVFNDDIVLAISTNELSLSAQEFDVPPFTYAEAGQIVWGSSNVSYVITLGLSDLTGRSVDYLIQLGGTPLPSLNTEAQANAFLDMVSSIGPAAAGSGFASGDVIDPATVPALLSVSEDDLAIGSVGSQLLSTGIGNDTLVASFVGGDTLDGGAGDDLADYGDVDLTSIVTYAIGNGLALSVAGGVPDILYGIERIEVFGQTLTPAELIAETAVPSVITDGTSGDDLLLGDNGDDRLDGLAGNDTLRGGNGNDTLIGGEGNDVITGGDASTDLRDLIYGGAGDDTIDGGYGNDELRGDAGNDSIAGGAGADFVLGGAGNDTLTGGSLGDLLSGGDGIDFINGGFGFDRMSGGDGGDRFFHLGIRDHGSDWIQDYDASEGDVLVFGGPASATAANFQVNLATTPTAGSGAVDEAFVIYVPTGQIIWALVDGAGQTDINIQLASGTFDLV